MKNLLLLGLGLIVFLGCNPCNKSIKHNTKEKTILISNQSQNLSLRVNYSQGCKVDELTINGKNKLSASGVYTSLKEDASVLTSCNSAEVKVKETGKGIEIQNIVYGEGLKINETWIFNTENDNIKWTINREYSEDKQLDDMSLPVWNFANLSVWKGGIFDNGGMVWCKYLADKNDTYGVHTGGVTFWNPDSGEGLRITPKTSSQIAAKYSHTEADEFSFTQYATSSELNQRHNLSRFVHKKADVFAPFEVKKGSVSIELDIKYVDYASEYSRGTLPGIDAEAVRELMNTTGRYGVVDNTIVGANGWITNWKCLHEPFFAQIGMALNDKNYTKNLSSTLDRERDVAILENGRVLSRWHDILGDEIAGTYDLKTGYYEAMWGYTIDSQTGYIINTAEQFDLNGDLQWLKSHKASCEKALDWLIARDVNNNGIFEMMNNNIKEQKASDWLDIVWAGFENSFVNAQMYAALTLWADCEKLMGDSEKHNYYMQTATKLKTSFNKSVNEGGFWHQEKKQYIYWRDQDGSMHGDNLVTPINFAAIAFGLCDDKERTKIILDNIEERNKAENLFHWPLCYQSFKREEVHANNWPFPRYENGDIFPTWGYLGIRAYVDYDKKLALKYIINILDQYKKDGLSSQRYSRTTQQGLGSDILAGICTSVTALYRDIYGIRPKWNRMGLEPNLSAVLNGTSFNYWLRDKNYQIELSEGNYKMSTNEFTVEASNAFGADFNNGTLTYYAGNKEDLIMTVKGNRKIPVDLQVNSKELSKWTINSNDTYEITIKGLTKTCQVFINDMLIDYKFDNGTANFSQKCVGKTEFTITYELPAEE